MRPSLKGSYKRGHSHIMTLILLNAGTSMLVDCRQPCRSGHGWGKRGKSSAAQGLGSHIACKACG